MISRKRQFTLLHFFLFLFMAYASYIIDASKKKQVYYVRKGDNGYELRKLFSTME